MLNQANRTFKKLTDIVPDDIFVGTSLILCQGGRFFYGIRPPKGEGLQQIMELTGIGGRIEEEDESLVAGVLREAQEEMGCGVRLLASDEAVIVRGADDVEWVQFDDEEASPVAVVFRRYRTPPHEPWHEDNQGEACIVVFLAELDGEPYPAMELPAFIWLEAAHIMQTAHQDVPLSSLLSAGAMLLENVTQPLADNLLVRLTDSQEALVLALGDHAVSFYNALAKK